MDVVHAWEPPVKQPQADGDGIERPGAQERLLRSVVDSLDSRMCILGDHGRIVGTNRLWDEFSVVMGWSSAQVALDADFYAVTRLLGEELGQSLRTAITDVLTGDVEQASVKGRLLVGAGAEDVVMRVNPVHGHEDARAIVTMIDISGAAAIQRELRRVTDEAQLLALVAQHTDNAVVITDVTGLIEWANGAFYRMTGFDVDEVLGRRRQDLIQGPFRRTPAFATLVEALFSERGADVQFRTQTKDGRSYWAHIEIQPIVEDGRIVRFVSVERDITRQRTAEEQLRAAMQQAQLLSDQLSSEKTLLSEVLGSIPHLVYWKDAQLRYTGVNLAFLTVRGLADEVAVMERTEDELVVQDELSAVLTTLEPEVLSSGRPVQNRRMMLTSPDRPARSLLLSVLPQFDDAGEARGVIGVAADVTHVTVLEQQLAQATRLESIGQLAAGIAHEINTPLQYVSDNTRFLAGAFASVMAVVQAAGEPAGQSPSPGPKLREALAGLDLAFLAEEIPHALSQSQEGLDRVTEIVRAMKDFSHPGQGRVEADLNRAVDSTVLVSRNEWSYVAELDLDLDPKLGMVRCYEGPLKQVLLNLVVNAAQAIGAERERTSTQALGKILVRTSRLADGVRITVTDDGPGMDEQVQGKIFDPFFTTKPVGKGTGQGLSMAYAVIVQKHGGELTVASAPGAGTTFTINLPDNPDLSASG
jgi:two-component system, NtrC family, sensor kinase